MGQQTDETNLAVLRQLKLTWQVILDMESDAELQENLRALCPHTQFQAVRELLTAAEQHNFGSIPVELLEAWFPSWSWSANIEQLFQHVEDSVSRTAKQDQATLPGTLSVAVRCMLRRLAVESEIQPVQLEEDDWEGAEVRHLKPKIWSPSSAEPCS